MANVQFKLGTQAAVDKLLVTPGTSVVEGSFYLTNDTHRLYIGQKASSDAANAQLFPVNEGVITVATVSDLPKVGDSDGAAFAGRFYYVTAGNILCVYNGKAWVQINTNTDTTITDYTTAVSATGDVGTIKETITLTGNAKKETSHTITGSNGVKVTASGSNLTIAGDSYTLTSTVASGVATISLNSANTANDTSIKVKQGSNVSITQDSSTKEITIAATDTTLSSATGASADKGFTVTVTDTKNISKTATITPQVKVGKTKTSTVDFVKGVATLDVYSAADIDDKMKALNAMVYKGTLGTDGTVSALPTTNISIGDTYLVSTRTTVGTKNVYPGSLIIARGTEDATTGYITGDVIWDVVESTQDSDTTYHFEAVANGVQMRSSTNSVTGTLKVVGDGTYTSVASSSSSASDNTQTLTVKHATKTQSDSTDAALTQSKVGTTTFTAVTGVTRDSAGHVSGIKTRSITLQDTNSAVSGVSYASSATNNTGTLTASVTTTNAVNAATTKTGSFTVGSSSLSVTSNAANNGLNINLTWGSF